MFVSWVVTGEPSLYFSAAQSFAFEDVEPRMAIPLLFGEKPEE
jgi:hypothetical protein